MEYILAIIGVVIGIIIGWLLGRQKAGIPKADYESLIKQEAAAQEKIKMLLDEVDTLTLNQEKNKNDFININKELAQTQAVLPHLEESLKNTKNERDELKKSEMTSNEKISNLNSKVSSLETEKQLLEQQLNTLKEHVDEAKKQAKLEFENLANQILDIKTKTFTESTEKSLGILLNPLRERIQTFEKTVDEKYNNESKERHALKSEIEKLMTLSDKMTLETNSLTQALRGDSKVQGDWGELVLERILEASGLREDHEYSLQKSYNSDEGDRFRPDVIINLPENKHVIVDSKVSLKAYDLYRSLDDEQVQNKNINDHIKSIEKHVDDLSSKHYTKLKGVNSPELVFMFIPIEPAYLLAMQKDHNLSTKAWKKGVAIVTATTLLTSLKTVASIWRLEKQNKNAIKIANEGAKLYDKFVGFLEDFEKIGKIFETGQKQYSEAMGKLKDGPGNVFRKMEFLKELGAAPNKKIKPDLLE